VWEAEHRLIGGRVAIKLLAGTRREGVALASRLRIEAYVLGRLRHPNLVPVADFRFTQAGSPYLVMPLLRGHTLEEELARQGPLPPAVSRAHALELLAALAALHDAGFVHRDVKPSNCFLSDEDQGVRLRLFDLGLCQRVTDPPSPRRHRGAICVGTPRYMAPEQAAGRRVDGRADVYAAGMVLYKMLADCCPFDEHASAAALLLAQQHQEPEPPSHFVAQRIPAALDALVLRAIAKDPGERFQTADELAGALRALRLRSRASSARKRVTRRGHGPG
jgi:eukaryotic-like serine/threonine-protein kinase